jgi:hypothetical protein
VGHREDPPEPPGAAPRWQVDIWRDERTGAAPFERWFRRADPYVQAVVDAVLTEVVEPHGIDLLGTPWCRALGDGLFEIRIRQSLRAVLTRGAARAETTDPASRTAQRTVLLRLFVTFHGARVVLLLHAYDKGRDPSDRRQRREIARARRHLAAWRQTG